MLACRCAGRHPCPAARAVGPLDAARLCGQRRRRRRLQQAHDDDVGDVQPGQHEARHHRRPVDVADGTAQLVGQDDQHQRRRDDLRQRARRGDHAAGQLAVIAVAQHDRQRYQPHRNDRGRHHTRGRGQHRAHEHHRDGQPAAHRAEQLADRLKQVLGHARALQHQHHQPPGTARN
ncbi:hypothetical protein G6F24_015238 [Rhizopus arrhizus]|nr:hypothetical protein G6F24_015238 [Rhizopus arrhizus]